MDQQANQQRPLALSHIHFDVNKAFEGDLLGRKKIAEQLTSYLERLRVGAVLAIDAPWGEGKTWFGRNWAKYLKDGPQDHKVIYLDAFSQDYVEDSFLMIASEIIHILENGRTKTAFKKNVLDVAKAFIANSPNLLINLGSKALLKASPDELIQDNDDLLKDIGDLSKNIANQWIERKLKDYENQKVSFANFRKRLKGFCEKQNKPVVIFIDELDRCRPTFAVQIIERIKHLFDVPNLVFVLLLNRKQLENAIKGVYGTGTDASAYLGKFVNLFFRLPKYKLRSGVNAQNHPTKAFIANVIARYEFNSSKETLFCKKDLKISTPSSDFIDKLFIWSIAKDLSLREIEHACALFVLSNAQNISLITYLIVLKIKYPNLYSQLERDEKSARKQAQKFLSGLITEKSIDKRHWADINYTALSELHSLQLGEISLENAPFLTKYGVELFGTSKFDKDSTFSYAFNLLDIPIESY